MPPASTSSPPPSRLASLSLFPLTLSRFFLVPPSHEYNWSRRRFPSLENKDPERGSPGLAAVDGETDDAGTCASEFTKAKLVGGKKRTLSERGKPAEERCNKRMARRDSCMARVTAGAAVGGAIGGAVPGLLKIRYIGQTTLGTGAVFGLFLAAGSLIHCGKSY